MKHKKLIVVFLLALWPGLAGAQTKLKVAYPTTVGSMAVVWVAKDARLFEKHGLDVELIYVAGSSKVVQAMLAKEIPISEIAIPAVIQANLAGADLIMLAGPNHKPGQKIMVKPEIKTPENLKGRKIGITIMRIASPSMNIPRISKRMLMSSKTTQGEPVNPSVAAMMALGICC